MPSDNISRIRRTQGQFDNRLRERLPPASPQLHAAGPVLRIDNRSSLLCVALMLAATTPRTTSSSRPGVEPSGRQPRSALGLLPGVPAISSGTAANAAGDGMLDRLIPVRPVLAPRASGIEHTAAALSSIGNAALGACVARPARCPQALLASSVAATATVAGAAVDTALELLLRPVPAPAAAARAPALSDAADRVLQQLPPRERHAVLTTLRECGTAPACTAQLRATLQSLPLPVQQAIGNALEHSATSTVGPASAGWPPAAQAVVPYAPASWLEAAISLLESAYDARQAAYLLDLEDISEATQLAQAGQPRGVRELLANQRRSATIEALFRATGHPVDRLPFNISAHDQRGVPRTAWGSNLLMTFAGPGAPAHTLMLVAHGDMTGTDTRSSGALDNGTGVATLLALARELHDTDLPRGTRVQLLVTDQGERGMMGAKAHVQRCLADGGQAGRGGGACPDAVLNLDMLGRGDGLAISGSDQRHLASIDAQRVDQRQPGVVDTREAHLRQLLEQAATDLRVPQHPARAWTQISDHLPFQREGIPALGLTRITRAEQDAEANLQATYAELLRRHAAVDWSRMDDHLNGRLDRADAEAMRDRLAEHEAVSRRYRRLGDSAYRAGVHDGFDQPDQVQTRAAMDTLGVVRRTVHAWLALPEPAPARPRA